ncbi:unnamed protein product [Rhizoctonia solani]|uniref:Transcription factor Aft1 HRA domain-containing protein n=1 Tax=Rhizoctonia solani TaxID=456999 RepID=A0A8H3GTW6_9AGAM|nr:unnamed protein product [Rhizoctonia solani]
MPPWFWLGSSASSGNPSLAWSLGNGGKGRTLIKFPLPLDDGWYKEQPCTTFRSFQHRKERSGFKHEFIVLQLLDGSVCRIERMGDPDARFDALSPRGSVAHDMAQCFRPDELDQACLGSSDIVAEVELPCDFDLMDVLKICRAIHEGEKTRNYTLQVFNCYFFSLAIQVCLTRLVAHWEDQALFEKWLSDINTGILALPATFQPLSNPSLRHGSILFRAYHALFPHNFESTQNSPLVEEIKLRLSLWINEHPEAILQEIIYRINNLLWHSTIDSGLYQFVEEKAKEAVLTVVLERMLPISNDDSDTNETPSLAMEKLKGEALLLLAQLLAIAGASADKIPKLNKILLKSKVHYLESHPARKPGKLGFKKSPTVQATRDFTADWYQWTIYYLSHVGLWLLHTALDIWGVTLFAIRNNSITCTMIDEKLERVAYEMEQMTRSGYTDLERLVDELRALSKSQVAVWGKNPWANLCNCITKFVLTNILKENETHKPVIWFCLKGKRKCRVLQSISAFQVHIQNRIEIQAKEVEGVWLGSSENIQTELVDTLSQVWKLIREDATLVKRERKGTKPQHHRGKKTNIRAWVRKIQRNRKLQEGEGNDESESESSSDGTRSTVSESPRDSDARLTLTQKDDTHEGPTLESWNDLENPRRREGADEAATSAYVNVVEQAGKLQAGRDNDENEESVQPEFDMSKNYPGDDVEEKDTNEQLSEESTLQSSSEPTEGNTSDQPDTGVPTITLNSPSEDLAGSSAITHISDERVLNPEYRPPPHSPPTYEDPMEYKTNNLGNEPPDLGNAPAVSGTPIFDPAAQHDGLPSVNAPVVSFESTPKPVLPPLVSLSSPGGPNAFGHWGLGSGGLPGSLRSGPLSPALLNGPKDPSGRVSGTGVGGWDPSHPAFRTGLTPDVGRTGLTPLVGGPVSFPPPSPNTAAFLAMVTNHTSGVSGGMTVGGALTGDMIIDSLPPPLQDGDQKQSRNRVGDATARVKAMVEKFEKEKKEAERREAERKEKRGFFAKLLG